MICFICINMKNKKKFYIFDLDGTLRHGITSKDLKAGKMKQQIVLPNVKRKLTEIKNSKAVSVGFSNQGFPSFGVITEIQVWKFVIYFKEHLLKNLIKDVRLDFYHPLGPLKHRYKNKRKPKPDIIYELLKDYKIKPKQAVFIGNAESDKKAAQNAGIDFIWAYDFFGWDKNNLELSEKFGWNWNKSKLSQELRK